MYTTYTANIHLVEDEILSSTHCLIAGASGCGKSVLIRRCLIACAAFGHHVALIDPKGCELRPWAGCANTWGYAEDHASIIYLLQSLVNEMENRLHGMTGFQRMWTGPQLWVFIDEYADLVSYKDKREVKTLVQRLAQKGRAAGIHVLLATQRPTADIIDGAIKVNITTRVALHVATTQDSRNIINTSGAELLPKHGECYMLRDAGEIDYLAVPMLTDEEEIRCVEYMTAQVPKKRSFWSRLFGKAA